MPILFRIPQKQDSQKDRFVRSMTILGRFKGPGEISRTRRKRCKQLEILNALPLEPLFPKMREPRSQKTFTMTS
jgi:hypothetical protein